eukprot:1176323-Pyramimonas_sp.AAC.1
MWIEIGVTVSEGICVSVVRGDCTVSFHARPQSFYVSVVYIDCDAQVLPTFSLACSLVPTCVLAPTVARC